MGESSHSSICLRNWRYGTSLGNAGSYGLYWSATPGGYSACNLYFGSDYYDWDYLNRHYG